ncbi:TonB-dependent receptor [Gracilimonas mengyeensis]|nr:TonB-dependent receptor [Gracilimonas mengyeensis]
MNKVLLTVFTLLFGVTLLSAQNTSSGHGQIRGTITDAGNGEVLIGVNVAIKGTSIGAATDIDGNYIIRRVPAGTHTLVVSYIGYERIEEEIEVEDGETLEYNVELVQVAVQGEGVTVSAQREGQIEAINQQITSDNIVNVVSETKIQELPDFNAAAALGRLPGVSTTQSSGEANKVVIRGLAPEYNAIEIEGVQLASTGSSTIGLSSNPGVGSGRVNNDRSVDLTMVSPYMIRMIEVYKSLTPDMNANSIGGTVNMELRKAPEGLHWDAMWQQGYTAKSNTLGNYRAVGSVSNRFLNNKLGVYALVNAESYDRNSDNLNTDYGIAGSIEEADPETGFRPVEVTSVSFNRHLETRDRLGANLILDYDLGKGSVKFVNMFASINSDFTDHNQSINYNNGRMDWRMSLGETEIQQRVHSLRVDYDFDWLQVNLSGSYTGARNTLEDSPVLTFNQTQAVNPAPRDNIQPENLVDRQADFRGIDDVILRSGNLFSNYYEEDKFTYKADFEIPFNIGAGANGFFKFGGQFVDQETSTDQETPYLAFDGNANATDDNIANSLSRTLRDQFGLTTNDQGVFTGTSLETRNDDLYDAFLGNDYGQVFFAANPNTLVDVLNFVIGNPDFDASNEERSSGAQGGWYDGPYQALSNDYTYQEDYFATYAMTKLNFGKFMVIGGARYEEVNSEYFAYNARDQRNAQAQIMYDTTSSASNSFLLPMVQGRFSVTDWMDLRYSYTQTLSRPDYNLLSPKFTITQGNSIYTGNPDLKPAKSENHDINLTFHANKIGLLSVGAFQKSIENFVYTASYQINLAEEAGIDQVSNYQLICNQYYRDKYDLSCADGAALITPVVNPTTGAATATVSRPVNNPNDGLVRGLEFDFQHNFWYLPRALSNMVFGINYARIFSEIETPFYDQGSRIVGEGRNVREEFFLVDSSFTSRLSGQPNHVMNTYLGFDYKGFSTRISVLLQTNTFGGSGGRYPENDRFSTDYLKIDYSAKYRVPMLGGNSEIFFDISNLNSANNQQVQRSINGDSNIQNYGLTANLGIRFRY